MNAEIDRPRAGDFRCIARLHSESITEGFLSTLGVPFLASLYEGIGAAPVSGLVVARSGSDVLGFAAYTANLPKCYRWVLAHRFVPIAVALLPRFVKVSEYRKMFETLVYPLRLGREKGRNGSLRPRAELLSLAVSDQARGCGIGKRLIIEVDSRFKALGIAEYHVVTYALDERSNGFYVRCGFRLVRSFTNHGKLMNEYLRNL